MNYAKELDRRDLVIAVWAAEFTRALRGETTSTGEILRNLAQSAAASADRAIEALRLLIDGVEFRDLLPDEHHDCRMAWDDFVASCRAGGLTDDDGHGELATDARVSNIRIYPGEALSVSYVRPNWATHVVWYNK